MAATAKQIAMGGLEEAGQKQARLDGARIWREQLWSALRQFTMAYVSVTGARGYDAVASELDEIWGPQGRPVSASILRAALNDAERNNFRAEWLDWFSERDEDVYDLLTHRVRSALSPDEKLTRLERSVRKHLGHKFAEMIIREAFGGEK
jgi:hypothetical protein